MDISNLNQKLQALNKMKISNLNNTDFNICIYWFRAVSHTLNRYVITPRSHHHTFFELHFILNGSVSYSFGNKTDDIIVSKGEYILISPMQMHKMTSNSDDFIKVSIAFSIPKNNILYSALTNKSIHTTTIPDYIKSGIEFILCESEKNADYSSMLIKNRILEFLCLIAGNIKSSSLQSSYINEADERILRAKKYINDNTNIFLSCNDVAQYCHLSSKQLGRLFKKYENVSLLKYIHDSKIREAERLLSEDEKTLKEISTATGFSNEYYFNRFFTAHTGMTPGDYRKAHPNNGENNNS